MPAYTSARADPVPDVAPCHRVLIVEDDLTSRAAMAFLLRHFGFAPVLAGTVQEAIAQIAAARPDCVVLDLMLPDGTGDRVLAAIRQQRLDIRVAVATGASDPALLSTVQALRPDVVFKKPLDMDRVTAWLRGT